MRRGPVSTKQRCRGVPRRGRSRLQLQGQQESRERVAVDVSAGRDLVCAQHAETALKERDKLWGHARMERWTTGRRVIDRATGRGDGGAGDHLRPE